MAIYTTNKEGLTFGEWVCIAGQGVFDQGLLRPYSTSETVIQYRDVSTAEARADHRVIAGIGRPYKKTYKTVFYPRCLRDAWKCGEDPTEWRLENEKF